MKDEPFLISHVLPLQYHNRWPLDYHICQNVNTMWVQRSPSYLSHTISSGIPSRYVFNGSSSLLIHYTVWTPWNLSINSQEKYAGVSGVVKTDSREGTISASDKQVSEHRERRKWPQIKLLQWKQYHCDPRVNLCCGNKFSFRYEDLQFNSSDGLCLYLQEES